MGKTRKKSKKGIHQKSTRISIMTKKSNILSEKRFSQTKKKNKKRILLLKNKSTDVFKKRNFN